MKDRAPSQDRPPQSEEAAAGVARSGARFDAVVFSGGGCRCFWEAGFWSTAAPAMELAPERVAGVSAGSAFACAALADRIEEVLAVFKERVARNPKNWYLRRALRGGRLCPHEDIYRETIFETLDEEGFRKVRSGPELRVLLARGPEWLGRGALALAALTHVLHRREMRVHSRWGRPLGFRPEVISSKSCADRAELADLIMQSSCVPPLTLFRRRGGSFTLDGGLIDNSPADLVGPARSTLVLLSFRHKTPLPEIEGRTYVQPSEDIPISEWDYTNPRLVQRTFDIGRADGERFAAKALQRQRR